MKYVLLVGINKVYIVRVDDACGGGCKDKIFVRVDMNLI